MNNDIKVVLDEKFNLIENLNSEELNLFYNVIENYLKNNRTLLDTFYYNIDLLKSYLEEQMLTEKEIIFAIINNPSYIHANKAELSFAFSMISVIQDSKTGKYMKDDIIVNFGKMLRIDSALIYARIKHIMFLIDSKSPILRNDFITIRKVLKVTNDEFEVTYGLNKEQLLAKYPITKEALEEINSWNEKYMIMKESMQNEEKRAK